MIPLRYKSVTHAARVIFSEEGLIGLYRGFGLHQISTAARLGVMMTAITAMDKLHTPE